jgi:hypothetical protein
MWTLLRTTPAGVREVVARKVPRGKVGASGLATRAPWCRSLRTSRRARYLAVRARRQFAAGRGRHLPDHARTVRCRDCGALFSLCAACDRGQAYCSTDCRARRRRMQRKAADARYRASPEARADARDRKRCSRARARVRTVTGQGSAATVAARTVPARMDEAPASGQRTEVARVHHSSSPTPIPLDRCARCMRSILFRVARPDRPRARSPRPLRTRSPRVARAP